MAFSTTLNNYWFCLYCQIENAPSSTKCQTCSYSKPTATPRAGPSALQRQMSRTALLWHCPRCTFTNGYNNKICKMCVHPIPKESLIPVATLRDLPALPWEDLAVAQHDFGHQALPANGSGRRFGKVNIDVQRTSHLLPGYWPLAKNDSSLKDGRVKAMKIYKNAIEILQLTDGLFVDPDFLPDTHSLHYEPNEKYMEHRVAKQIAWLRPRDIVSKYNDKWTVFKDARNPAAKDICQGVLGNCWFISALSVLAETPEFVENIVLTKEVCQEGVYLVRLCKDGRWTPIMLDDTFPCDRHRRLQYCQGKGNQLWIPLVEKAAAKLLGCYEALANGNSHFGFSMLTGAPCQEIHLPDNGAEPADPDEEANPDFIWAQICSCLNVGFPMGASCGRHNRSSVQYKSIGLSDNHSYSVLNVWEESELNLRLVQLRDPWGESKWTGDWCDKSCLWTGKLKSALLTNGATTDRQSDGIFWMTYQDLNKYFSTINVCEVRGDWLEIRTEGILPSSSLDCDNWLMRKIVVEVKTEVTLTLYQDSQRHIPDTRRRLRDLCVLVFREAGDNLESLVLHSVRKTMESVNCHGHLEPGTYVVICFSFNRWSSLIDDSDDVNPMCVLAIHSGEILRFDNKFKPDIDLFTESLFLFAKNAGNSREMTQDGVTVHYVIQKCSGAIAVIVNPTNNRIATVKFNFNDSSNMVSTRGILNTEDVVPPKKRMILNIVTQADYHIGYKVGLSIELVVKKSINYRNNQRTRKLSSHTFQLHEQMTINDS